MGLETIHQFYKYRPGAGLELQQFYQYRPGPEVIKPISCSTQLSRRFIMLINVKMPTIVGILISIGMVNTAYESLEVEKSLFCSILVFFDQLKFVLI